MTGKHDDDLADALALVFAVRENDTEGMKAVLRHGNVYAVALTLAKLFAVFMRDYAVDPESFRSWAGRAIQKP